MSDESAKFALAVGNYLVAAMDLVAATASGEPRDWLAALCWAGSGTYWIWRTWLSCKEEK